MKTNNELTLAYENNRVLKSHLELLTQNEGSTSTSKDRYRPISTLKVVDFFARQGFNPVSMSKSNPTSPENRGFEKHKVELAMPEGLNLKINGLKPRLHIVNSYNAKNSLRFYLGVYRMVCSNGLVVGDGLFFNRITHVGDVDAKLSRALNESQTALDLVATSIRNWEDFTLSPSQAEELARRLINIRLPKNTEFRRILINDHTIKRALRVRRSADAEENFFTVFNRIQENLIERPILKYTVEVTDKNTGSKSLKFQSLRSVRPLSQVAMNAQIWSEADAFYKEVA